MEFIDSWVSSSADSLVKELVKKNKSNLLGNRILGYTTRKQVIQVLHDLRSLILPGIFESEPANNDTIEAVLAQSIPKVAYDLCTIIKSVLYYECQKASVPEECLRRAERITVKVLEGLPAVREVLDMDIRAAYEGDPAAKSFEEIILSYPCFEAISIFRIAHLIGSLGVPIIPRIMTEYAHKNTGIDIHPGAQIGNSFFIDHGTGVVIGETCVIGNNVKLYQGVTLGAKSFPLDESGNPVKGIKRHPNIEDNVIIYSGATLLGNITIGHHSIIGGNVWLTESVKPYSKVFNSQPAPVIKSS
ncbi:MAG TPA: serine acetyltransferase [Clostridiales bacterium]|jgi:serine O-acetyltransferase|nr:serine acetyltransferase [Clostridiales bacterium]